MAKTSVNRIELESKLLGAVLANSDKLYELPAAITDAVFSHGVLAKVWKALHRQAKAKKLPPGALDLAAVCTWSGLDGDEVRDMLDAILEASRGCRLDQVAAALLDAHRRSGVTEALERGRSALESGEETEQIIEQVQSGIQNLGQTGVPETVSTRDAMISTIDAITLCQSDAGYVLPTGFPDLDRKLKLRPANFVVLAARPSVGKTTLAMNIACNVAGLQSPKQPGKRVLYHSLEMPREDLMILALSRFAHIDSNKFFENQTLTPSELERMLRESERIAQNTNLNINDQYSSLSAICSISRKEARKYPMGSDNPLVLVVVDYLQLIRNQMHGRTRENEVSGISNALRELAKELGIPVLALSQLNRTASTKNKSLKKNLGRGEDAAPVFLAPPELDELRESGALEQDAYAVVFIHNPFANSQDEIQKQHGPFDLIIAKQRLGKKGAVQVYADLAMSEFKSFSREAK